MGFQALWGITYLCHGAKFVIFPSASNKDLTPMNVTIPGKLIFLLFYQLILQTFHKIN
jgi:hypothetical protein